MSGQTSAADLIRSKEKFLIIFHEDPDGDALGASLALRAGLLWLGKSVIVACRDEPPPPFRFLPDAPYIQHDFLVGDADALIVVDCGDLARTGFPERIQQFWQLRKPIINLDHHPRNDLHRLATVNVVDPSVAASVQIVATLLAELDIPIKPRLATQLLTGLYTDTGGFKHTNTSPAVLALASSLLAKGARLKQIVRHVTATRTLPALKLWGIALSRVRRHPDLPLALSMISQADLQKSRASANDLGGVVNMINSIPGTEAAVLFTELSPGDIKVSLRTESEAVDVARIASMFEGGGHRKAAGFRLKGKILQQNDAWQIVPDSNTESSLAFNTVTADVGA